MQLFCACTRTEHSPQRSSTVRDVQPRQVAVQPVHDESPPLAQAENETLIVVERAGQGPEFKFKDQVRNVKPPTKLDYMSDRPGPDQRDADTDFMLALFEFLEEAKWSGFK